MFPICAILLGIMEISPMSVSLSPQANEYELSADDFYHIAQAFSAYLADPMLQPKDKMKIRILSERFHEAFTAWIEPNVD